jgi:SAM-dependent methyltransferase
LHEYAGSKVLDFGAGSLRNSIHLLDLGFKVTAFDLKTIEDRFGKEYQDFRRRGGNVTFTIPSRKRFKIVVITFALETICCRGQRLDALRAVFHMMKPDGVLIISIRGPADLVTANGSGRRCSDGFFTPNLTFSRSYSAKQLENLVRAAGFRRIEFLHAEGTKNPELLHALAFHN